VHPVGTGMVRPYIMKSADSGKTNRHTCGVLKSVGVA